MAKGSENPEFPTTPVGSVTLPSTPLVRAAYAYIYQHTSPAVANHTIRSAFFSLILHKKIPGMAAQVDVETLVLATLLHDLGWSHTPELVSKDKRFEVDGANDARDFVRSNRDVADAETEGAKRWDEDHLQSLWYAIALHTTPSIALHADPLTALTAIGILSDFMGPNLPSDVSGLVNAITPGEFTEIIRAYPRLGFKDELTTIICGLCRSKPEATFDNFAADFGIKYVDGYQEKRKEYTIEEMLSEALDATAQFE